MTGYAQSDDKEPPRCTAYQVLFPQRPRHPHGLSRRPGPAEASPAQAEDRKRIALGLNDVVVRRLLTAGQDLQAALGLMGNHPASGKIRHAVDEMDQAVRDIPDTVFDHPAGDRPPLDTSTSTT